MEVKVDSSNRYEEPEPVDMRLDANINPGAIASFVVNLARITTDLELDMGYPLSDDIEPPELVAPQAPPGDIDSVFMITECPQCKSEIIFTIKRLAFINIMTSLKSLSTRMFQYGGLFLGFTLAVTGIVTMGYVGFTSCGLKMMECIIPGNLLVKLLSRNGGNSYEKLSDLLLRRPDAGIDNLETALLKGLVDPFKFSRVPVLPMVLYRMPQSLISSVLFGNSFDNPYPWNSLITEGLISAYMSSLGNHELALSILGNAHKMILDPTSGTRLFSGINFWKTTNMILMLVPIRWAYDILHRVTINQAYFGLTLQMRPRDIVNSMPQKEVDRLEDINNSIGELHQQHYITQQRLNVNKPELSWLEKLLRKWKLFSQLLRLGLYVKWVKYAVLSRVYLLWACLRYDYSKNYTTSSVSIRWLETFAWPYLSLKVGLVICLVIVKQFAPTVPHDKLVLLLNLLGMVVTVAVRDFATYIFGRHKASQMSNLTVVCQHEVDVETDVEEPPPSFPGAYL